ncbi:MAG: DUF3795 domain-containing protein [Actinomycetia bacterium]|nr:DUF3795 domain-containing protein [Actinomycetes bacterium]
MNTKSKIKAKLIAPCGMNCGICIGHLRDRNKCDGCRNSYENKPEACRKCIIIRCDNLKKTKSKFCSEKCEKFPCTRLKNLDKRYRTKYNMSMLENLKNIEKLGIRAFVKNEKVRWACSECGGIISVHRGYCSECGKKKIK